MIQFEEAMLCLTKDAEAITIKDDDDACSTRSSITAVNDQTHDYKVALDQQYISSTVEPSCPKATSDDFDRLCVLGRGA